MSYVCGKPGTKKDGTVIVSPIALKALLDHNIVQTRLKRKDAQSPQEEAFHIGAVDAYQTIRLNIIGDHLPALDGMPVLRTFGIDDQAVAEVHSLPVIPKRPVLRFNHLEGPGWWIDFEDNGKHRYTTLGSGTTPESALVASFSHLSLWQLFRLWWRAQH